MAKSIIGGVEIINTLSTKNNGDYPLVMAESVNLNSGKTIEESVIKINQDIVKIQENVTKHESNTSAHSDIRKLISSLTEKLNTIANSDDETLDQLSEIVSYIKNNKSLIDNVTKNKVNIDDIVNNLTTNDEKKPLSASMGVEIKKLIDTLKNNLNNVTNDKQVKGLASGTITDNIVTWGTDGYTVKDSGFTIGKSVPADAKFTDTIYTHPDTHPATMITEDATHKFVTETEKNIWNAKVNKNQGVGNKDKVMAVDSSGNVVPIAIKKLSYNAETRYIEYK